MSSIKLLGPPDYSAEEQQALIDFVLALRKSHIQDFLRQVELPCLVRSKTCESDFRRPSTKVTSHTNSWLISSTPWPLGGNNTFSSTTVLNTTYKCGTTPIMSMAF